MRELIDLFQFPDQYKVDESIPKERYLQESNLSEKERRDIEKYVDLIKILYDIHFADESEFIIMEVSLNTAHKSWDKKQIAQAVASSISYPSMVCVNYQRLVRAFAFLTMPNKRNGMRTSIIKMAMTPLINIENCNYYMQVYFNNIREELKNHNSSLSFQYSVFCVTEDCRDNDPLKLPPWEREKLRKTENIRYRLNSGFDDSLLSNYINDDWNRNSKILSNQEYVVLDSEECSKSLYDSANDDNRYEEIALLKEKRTKEIEEQKELLIKLEQELNAYDYSFIIGITVVHQVFGNGIIISLDGKRILVQFEDYQKWFVFPNVFDDKHLDTTDMGAKELIFKIVKLNKDIIASKAKITLYQNELNSHGG